MDRNQVQLVALETK